MYFSVAYLVEFIVKTAFRQNLVDMVTVGVGDENLTELLAGHQLDNLLYALGIELVEDIVEQE
jgi:hypothetical protein